MNKKVMAMFEKAEDEYNDLISKKNIIEVSIVKSLILFPSYVCIYADFLCRMTSQKSKWLLKSLTRRRRRHLKLLGLKLTS